MDQTLRRGFLARSIAIAASALAGAPEAALAAGEVKRRSGTKIKLALNSYSFNRPLMAGQMSLDDVIDYCAAHNIDGVDLTGYYFPGISQGPDRRIHLQPEEEGLPQRRFHQRHRRAQRLHPRRCRGPQGAASSW